MTTTTCPHCDANLQRSDLEAGTCPHCGRELRPSDEDRPITPDEAADEASKDSFPASDPPAW